MNSTYRSLLSIAVGVIWGVGLPGMAWGGDGGAVEEVDDVQLVATSAPDETVDYFWTSSATITDRVVNIHRAQTVRRGALQFLIDHRAYSSFLSGEDAWFDYLGLDAGGLKIGLGFRYGILDFLDAGFYRLSNGMEAFDIYEVDTKLTFLQQEKAFINAALRVGYSWFVQKDSPDRVGLLSQLMLDRRFGGRFLVGAGFAFHTHSGVEGEFVSQRDPAAALTGYLEWRPVQRFSLNAEIAANVAGDAQDYPVFAFSTRFLTYRHSFSLIVSNSQYMAADGQVANSNRDFSELVFGFQIIREFNFID